MEPPSNGLKPGEIAGIVIAAVGVAAAAIAASIILYRRYQAQHSIEGQLKALRANFEDIKEADYNFAFLKYSDLQIGEQLGQGSFGSVYKGTPHIS